MLHSVPLLSACNKKELRLIANLGTRADRDRWHGAHRTGRAGPGVFFAFERRCSLLRKWQAGVHLRCGRLLRRDGAVRPGPCHATVVVQGQAELLVLDGTEFSRLLDVSPSITRKLLSALAERERANATVRS